MKAVKLDEPWKVACIETEKPVPKEGEALIRIVTAGWGYGQKIGERSQ